MSDSLVYLLEIEIKAYVREAFYNDATLTLSPERARELAERLADKLIAGRESMRSGRRRYDRLRETLSRFWPRR